MIITPFGLSAKISLILMLMLMVGTVAAEIVVTNGDFNDGDADWYYEQVEGNWWEGTFFSTANNPFDGSGLMGLSGMMGPDGVLYSWAYQGIGTRGSVKLLEVSLDAGSFTDAGGDRDMEITIAVYQSDGSFVPAINTDIDGASGMKLIDSFSTITGPLAPGESVAISGILDLSSANAINELFIRLSNGAGSVGDPWAALDNLVIFGFNTDIASSPSPENQAIDVLNNVVLDWEAGMSAATHNVYLGTVFDDVNNADTAESLGVLVSEGQDVNSLEVGILEFGQTYYWRVDEVNGAPDNTIFKGDVWSFTVEPYSIPVELITATASSTHAADMDPNNTINGIGLDESDQHSTEGAEMWLSGMGDLTPTIQYAFDKPYKLHEMWVWNSNQVIESFVGIGAKDVVIEYSVDGVAWQILGETHQFAQAPGSPTYTANTKVDFGGVLAKHVKITINSGYGLLPQYGLSAVRFYNIPTFPREPQPASGDVIDGADVVLVWRAGREAASHEVYLGTDAENLPLVDTVADATYVATALMYDTTYYWQILEVNEAEVPTNYVGPVWSFTTPAYAIVDGFETYTDGEGSRIYESWSDGWNDDNNGSQVGYSFEPFAEQTIVKSGTQSMPLAYDGAISEATLSFEAQNWTASGIKSLSIAFYGTPDNTGELYVKINNTKIAYDGDSANIARGIWQTWNIDLTGRNGMENVTSISLGVDGASAAGLLYIDEIRLHPKEVVNGAFVVVSNGDFNDGESDWYYEQVEGNWWEGTFFGTNNSPFDGSGLMGLSGMTGPDGIPYSWAYQSIGAKDDSATTLEVSLDVGSFTDAGGERDIELTVSLYQSDGTFVPGINTDVDGAPGIVLIDSFNTTTGPLAPGGTVAISDVLDLSSANATGELFIRLSNGAGTVGDPWAAIDNVVGIFE